MKLFPLGQIVATPGALGACSETHLAACLRRHATGDWGVVCAEDKATNDEALELGNRLLSAYPIDPRSRARVRPEPPRITRATPATFRCQTSTE
jgi:hypothetical protein